MRRFKTIHLVTTARTLVRKHTRAASYRSAVPWLGLFAVMTVAVGGLWYAAGTIPQPLLPSPLPSLLATPEALSSPSPLTATLPLPIPDIAGLRTPILTPPIRPATITVSLTGVDEPGRGSATRPLRTIGYALTQARPGAVIVVLPGTYAEHVMTSKPGTASAPITLRAQGAVRLTRGAGSGRIMEIRHSYYHLSGFEFAEGDVLLWVQGASHVVINNNQFHDADGECVRFKYHAKHNRFTNNIVRRCGREDFGGGGDGKNGEGVYLGTAPEQLDRNPTPESDATSANLIAANTFVTEGNECVDIKEGAEKNIVEFNDCTGQRDPESAGLDSRGNNNTFRYNKSYNNAGAGIRFGGDDATDGINNAAYGNALTGNQQVALKVQRLPQGLICGNTTAGNKGGVTNNDAITNPPCASPLPAAGNIKQR